MHVSTLELGSYTQHIFLKAEIEHFKNPKSKDWGRLVITCL